MYLATDSLLPEHQGPLIITTAPCGPQWMPSDYPEDWRSPGTPRWTISKGMATLLAVASPI
jgi:hypothetical protein